MNGKPDAAPPPRATGIDLDYPQILRELEECRRSADLALLRKMIDLPDPHPGSRSGGQ
jgi:hypothetical protein